MTRTVTISFDTPVWFVDDTFGGTADGSAGAPFTSTGAAAAHRTLALRDAVAVNPHVAMTALLHRLARSSSPSVREHAELALVDHELRHADDEGIARLYHEHRDHPSWGYGLRYRLVIDPRTPRAVLQSIASDHDPIGAQARRRLGQEATG